jgi:hypothetical protein
VIGWPGHCSRAARAAAPADRVLRRDGRQTGYACISSAVACSPPPASINRYVSSSSSVAPPALSCNTRSACTRASSNFLASTATPNRASASSTGVVATASARAFARDDERALDGFDARATCSIPATVSRAAARRSPPPRAVR